MRVGRVRLSGMTFPEGFMSSVRSDTVVWCDGQHSGRPRLRLACVAGVKAMTGSFEGLDRLPADVVRRVADRAFIQRAGIDASREACAMKDDAERAACKAGVGRSEELVVREYDRQAAESSERKLVRREPPEKKTSGLSAVASRVAINRALRACATDPCRLGVKLVNGWIDFLTKHGWEPTSAQIREASSLAVQQCRTSECMAGVASAVVELTKEE